MPDDFITASRFSELILKVTSASAFEVEEILQELWSGYGQILRLRLIGGSCDTVIAKLISLPDQKNHPRGWDTDLSHQRKLRSYQVEGHWYQHYNARCDRSRTPQLIVAKRHGEQTLLLLEDLDAAGFPLLRSSVSREEVNLCLLWLAEFHATFLQEKPKAPDGLWQTGTYWHLDTRPDELDALEDETLKAAAPAIDKALRHARFQTLVHGDAKLANFCFSEHSDQVAALDFQYVGRGCGIKDVAYFLGSCVDEATLTKEQDLYLDSYFQFLFKAMVARESLLDPQRVINEWRQLYPLACVDFFRFLKGWCPSHWKLNSHSEQLIREVLSL